MNNINKAMPYPPYRQTSPKTPRRHNDTERIPDAAEQVRQDYTDLSSEWGTTKDAQALLDELLSSFSKSYPDLNIFITDQLDKNSLADAAAALGEGTHLLLSTEFLAEMKSSQEAYQKGKSILLRLLGQLSANGDANRAQGVYVGKDEALLWSAPKLPEMPQKPLPNAPNAMFPPKKEDTESLPSPIEQLWLEQESARKTYAEMRKQRTKASIKSVSSYYASLSSARSKEQVQHVLAKTQRNIANLRLASSFGEAEDRIKARAAIASMQKLLQRGGRKIRRLNEEELVTLRQKRAQRVQDQQKALQLRLEREMLRAKRRSADGAIKKEGELDELNQAMRFRRHSKYNPYDTLGSAATIPVLPDAPVSAPAVGGAVAPAPVAAADISITSVSIEF